MNYDSAQFVLGSCTGPCKELDVAVDMEFSSACSANGNQDDSSTN